MPDPRDGYRRPRPRTSPSRRLFPLTVAGAAVATAVAVAVAVATGTGGLHLFSAASPVTARSPLAGTGSSARAASAAPSDGSARTGSGRTGNDQAGSGRTGTGRAGSVAPPAGSLVQDVLRGKGTLEYRCSAGTYGLTRTSVKLYVENGGYAGTQSGLRSWRFKNGTRVDASLVTQVPSRTTLSQALFRVTKVHGGDANDRATTYIVRTPDSGGLPPQTCATTGKRLRVPFQTHYVFYRSATS